MSNTAPLFRKGDFVLHSGEHSSFKIDCDSLTDADLEAIAHQMFVRLPWDIGKVEGVPTGGLRLASIMQRYATGHPHDPLLIVDDVYTTGASMEAHRKGRSAIGMVIFARQAPTQEWIKALFTMPPHFRWPWSIAPEDSGSQ